MKYRHFFDSIFVSVNGIVSAIGFAICAVLVSIGTIPVAFAIEAGAVDQLSIQQLPDVTTYNDFVVGPGKFEMELKPGDTRTTNMIVTNRLGKTKTFQVQIEDFQGSRDPLQTVILLDNERGPYSLKDYINIPVKTFSIGQAERVTIPVTVHIPTDAPPGGLYGSVVVSTVSDPVDQSLTEENSTGRSPVITRIGSLFFIKVAGEVREDGKLTDFRLRDDTKVLSSGPVNFQMLYENNGTIHESPYGIISVRNMLGSEVAYLELEPWFALPNSLRLREVVWNSPFLIGKYIATAEINRGYDNIVDTMEVSFWVIPWKVAVIIFVALVIIILLIRLISRKFSIVVRK